MKVSKRLAVAISLLTLSGVPSQAFHHGVFFAGNGGGMLLNLDNIAFFTGYNAFLNWWKTGDVFNLVSTTNGALSGQAIWDNGTYLNQTTGELQTPLPADVTSFERGFFTPVQYPQFQYEGTSFNNFAGEQFDVTWTGCASPTVSASGSLGTGGTITSGANSATFVMGTTGLANVTLKFTFTGIAACYSSPPHNIKIFQHRYAANVTAGQIFNPDWLADVKQFAFLRLMDWMDTNFNGISDSSQLADANYSSFIQQFDMANGVGGITGPLLTISGFNSGTPFHVGQKIVCIGCTAGTTITSLGTGTGGAGTYNLSASSSVSGQIILGIPTVGANSVQGPKGGIHPSLACALANAANTNIEYPIPIAATNQFVTDVASAFKACMNPGLKVKYSYGNENWNFGFNTFRYSTAQTTANWPGFRAAQVMEIIAGVYGTTSGTGWIGTIGSQLAGPTNTTNYITGAMAWITGEPSAFTLKQLFSQVDIAPYWGNFYDGVVFSNITASATPTITANNDNGSGQPFLTNGQVIKLFVNGGTMASVLNNAFATVSSATTTSFVININTTGLTYGGSGNGAMDATIFKLADQSTVLNTSTPATYPTKFAYFNQQMSKAILNGSASDVSYGTITVGAALNLTTGANSILDFLQQNALITQSNGLILSQYEGGPTQTLVGNGSFPLRPNQAVEFLNVSLFDAGVTGDTTNTSANLFAAMYQQFNSVNGVYPAQFNDATPMTPFGPWGALRFFPGDESNVKWHAITTQNALGPHVDPTPPATWTASFPGAGTNRFFSNASCSGNCADTLTGAVIGTASASIKLMATLTGGAPVSATCDGVTVSTPDVSSNTDGSRTSVIYTIPVGAGTNARSCTFTSSGSAFQNRIFYVVPVRGLNSTAPISTPVTASGVAKINYTKGGLLLQVSACTGAYTNTSGVSPLSGVPTTTASFSDIDTTDGTAEMTGLSATFSSVLFSVSPGCPNSGAAAVYR